MAALVFVSLLATTGLLSSCSKGGPTVETALPSLGVGCTARAANNLQSIPFSERSDGNGKLPVLAVCIDGVGPYPFMLSTGAGSSVISPALVHSLDLAASSTASTIRGVTCLTTSPQVQVNRWSLGGIVLAPQSLVVASVPSQGPTTQVEGIIGSDVLARFGAIRIDYGARTLVVARPEGPAPTGNVIILGQPSTRPTAGLVGASTVPKAGSVLRVFESTAGTQIATAVTLAGHAEQFTVDSGSASSSVNATLASSLKLASTGKEEPLWGVGCTSSASTVSSGPWGLGSLAFQPGQLVSQSLPGAANEAVDGVIGSDVLSSYGSVVVDYEGAHLWLGAR